MTEVETLLQNIRAAAPGMADALVADFLTNDPHAKTLTEGMAIVAAGACPPEKLPKMQELLAVLLADVRARLLQRGEEAAAAIRNIGDTIARAGGFDPDSPAAAVATGRQTLNFDSSTQTETP